MERAVTPAGSAAVASSGIAGLDDILCGGFVRRRLYLVEGVPGSGKTTLALQFLIAGVRAGESVLYVTLSETAEELQSVAASHDFSLDGIQIRELTPSEGTLDIDEQNTLFHPSEIELASTTKLILDDVERLKPSRVVFDSLSELRLLAGSALRYRRQILALKQFFATRECTVMLLDDMTATDHDLQMQSIAHGVVLLEQLNPEYGAERRRLRVVKYRGVKFRGGYHDYVIDKGGLAVFPRLVAAEHRQSATRAKLPSDIPELDALLGGGIEEGTSTLIVGAAGTGKSTLAAQFAAAAARRGQRSALFIFDESPTTLTVRCTALGVELDKAIEAGHVSLQQIDPAELTPGEFTHAIREAVTKDNAKVVVIDSLNGYLNAMPEERHLTIQLHELLMYLGQMGVATILVGAQQGLIGSQMTTPVDASYLADAVVLLRYFEYRGEVRQAISVMKKRGSRHERTLREFRLDGGCISVGAPLRQFRGVLTGVPSYENSPPVGDQEDRMTVVQSDTDRRVLFLAATTKDGATTQAMLSPLGIRVDVCRTFEAMLRQIDDGAGAVVLPEEAATADNNAAFKRLLASQPPWSDLPLLILTRPGADSPDIVNAVRTLGNVTLLERPLRIATLVSAVRTAIRARDRQYQIREHLAERATAEEALRLADQRKDEFLATLGHELRNPLSPLLTAIHLLKTAGLTDPVAVRVGGVMERQIRHLVRLVDDLLEVSRITRGLIEIQREYLDLSAVIQAAIDTSKPLLDAAGHHLSVQLPPERITVHGDVVRLTQVFANLLTNAAKYTDAGGEVVVGVRREGARAVVSVRDNGIGIATDQLSSVFDMFTQVDRSNRRAQGGLGIGLTLVKSLVSMHDGCVEARSEGLGHGSEFLLELPVVERRVGTQPAPPMPLKPFPRRRILVVDDNKDAAETLGELLTALGAVVAVVHNGRAAIAELDSFQPDSMVLDIGMPGMDGYEVARRVRASADHHHVLLIALTGWGQEHDQRRSALAGFDHHVVKPPDIDKLRQLFVADWPSDRRDLRSTSVT